MAETGGVRTFVVRGLAVVLLAAGLAAVVPTPAAAALVETDDAAGDVGDCQGDITRGWTRTSSRPTLELGVRTRCGLPNGPTSWPAGNQVAWELDVDGDGGADWIVRAIGGQYDIAVEPGGSGPGPNGCSVSQVGADRDGRFEWTGVVFETRCIGGPTTVRVRLQVRWGGAIDTAPDGGFAAAADFPPTPRPATTRHGYWMIDRSGATYAFGDAAWLGNTAAPADVVDIEPTISGNGYWTVDSRGHVYAFGDAQPLTLPEPEPGWSPLRPGERITSLSRRVVPGTSNYPDRVDELWLFSDRGAVYVAGGYSNRYGDLSTVRLNGPVVDSVARNDGMGYWMVASDGGIFTFGLARFFGSMGDQRLNAPVQSLVPDPDGVGYWLVAGDGGIFAFDAPFLGSMGDTRLNQPIVGMVSSGSGYLMVASDGGIFTFGEASFFGSLGDHPPAAPIVAVAALDV
jgi:hypothetical protein